MKFRIFLLLALGGIGWAGGADNLRLAVYRPLRVSFEAAPLAPVAVERGAMLASAPSPAVDVGFLNPEAIIAAEIRRWRIGESNAPLAREPLPGNSLGRWVSLGGMPPPAVQVSVIAGSRVVSARTEGRN